MIKFLKRVEKVFKNNFHIFKIFSNKFKNLKKGKMHNRLMIYCKVSHRQPFRLSFCYFNVHHIPHTNKKKIFNDPTDWIHSCLAQSSCCVVLIETRPTPKKSSTMCLLFKWSARQDENIVLITFWHDNKEIYGESYELDGRFLIFCCYWLLIYRLWWAWWVLNFFFWQILDSDQTNLWFLDF